MAENLGISSEASGLLTEPEKMGAATLAGLVHISFQQVQGSPGPVGPSWG